MVTRELFDADRLWGEAKCGSTFRSKTRNGTFFLLVRKKRNYGAREVTFYPIVRGKRRIQAITVSALDGARDLPLELVWEPQESMEVLEVIRMRNFIRGLPEREYLKKKHNKDTKATMLSDGVL